MDKDHEKRWPAFFGMWATVKTWVKPMFRVAARASVQALVANLVSYWFSS